jgi:hypothetical protein
VQPGVQRDNAAPHLGRADLVERGLTAQRHRALRAVLHEESAGSRQRLRGIK